MLTGNADDAAAGGSDGGPGKIDAVVKTDVGT